MNVVPKKFSRRQLLKLSSCVLPGMALAPAVVSGRGAGTRVQRLNWAGIRIVAGERTLWVDPVITDIWQGESPYPMVDPGSLDGRHYALVTHLHGDHFDVPGLQRILGERGRVICDAEMAPYIASQNLKVIPVRRYEPAVRGPFTVIPLTAVDGLGDPQVSWLIRANGLRFLHCGDTMPHGAWRLWGSAYGPIDVAFLPVNGALQADVPASEVPLSMSPAQAVDAAVLLGATRLVPIHYGYHVPGSYEEQPRVLETLKAEAQRRSVRLEVVRPGDWLASD